MSLRTLIRGLFVSTPYAREMDLSGRHVIVTGAGPGSLGYATAKTLARWGAVVIVTTRSSTAAAVASLNREVTGTAGRIDGHDLDLCDAGSVNRFTRWYLENYGERLDVLVNNAGVHLDLMAQWKEPRLTADGTCSDRRRYSAMSLATPPVTSDTVP